MDTSVICLGRNVGSVPMSAPRWAQFTTDALQLLYKHEAVILNIASGIGYWEGGQEDSFIVSFQGSLEGVRADLPVLAFLYEQEAIGLIVGVSVLVS